MDLLLSSVRIISLLMLLLSSATGDWSRENPSNQSKPSFKTPPNLTWPHRPITAPHSIRLQCFIQSTSAFSVKWTKNDAPLENSKFVSISNENQLATIEHTSAEDTGNYFCKGCNSAGCITHTQYIEVKESWTSPPLVTDIEPPGGIAYVELGESVNISCSFSSGNICFKQTADWFRNEERLMDSDRVNKRTSAECEDGEKTLFLSLRNITEEDLGLYTCFGKNDIGNVSRVIGLHLLNSTEPHQDKDKKLALILGCSMGGLFVITILIIVVVRRRCRKIEYGVIDWPQPDLAKFEIPEHELAYDVFLSYSSADLEWVQPVLFNTLRQSGYQVCADFKDFTPGAAVVDNILDAIYKSKRTLIVMSECFLRSVWTKFELDQAHVKAMALRKDVIILIKIDDCKIPAKLLGITFLDWTDHKVKPHFWTRLCDAIGPPGDFHRQAPKEEHRQPNQPDKPMENNVITETIENDTQPLIGQLLTNNTIPTNNFLQRVLNQPIAV